MSFTRLALLVATAVVGSFSVMTSSFVGLVMTLVLAVLTFRNLDHIAVSDNNQAISSHTIFWSLSTGAVVCSILAAIVSIRPGTNLLAFALWATAVSFITIGAWRHDNLQFSLRTRLAQLRHRPLALEIGGVLLLTLFALALRAWDLAHYPPVIHGDEGEMGVFALNILKGTYYPIFGTSPYFGLPYLFNYLQAGSLALFGRDEVGLRMLSALFGTACVPYLYLLGRIGWGRLGGAVAGWLMSVSHLHIHYSRMAAIFIPSVFCMILVLLLLAYLNERALAQRTSTPAGTGQEMPVTPYVEMTLCVAIGLVIGFGQYFYYASRVIPIIAAPIILYLLIHKRISFRQVILIGLAVVVAYAPLAAHYVTNPIAFFGRLSDVSVFREGGVKHTLGPNAVLPRDLVPLLNLQLRRILGLFVRGGDAGSFYTPQFPAFDLLTSLLLWLGVGVALTRARRYHEFAALVWLGLGIILGGVFTIDAPSAQRLLIVIPAVYLLGGICVARSWQLITKLTRVQLRLAALPLLAIAAGWGLLTNYTIYFGEYARLASGSHPIVIARELLKQPQPYEAYLMSTPVMFPDHGTIKFAADGIPLHNLETVDELPPPGLSTKSTLIIALAHRVNDLKAIETRYPGGVETTYKDALDRIVYVTYRIEP